MSNRYNTIDRWWWAKINDVILLSSRVNPHLVGYNSVNTILIVYQGDHSTGKIGKIATTKIPCMENSGNLKNSLKHRENTGKNLQPEGGIRKRRRKIWERAAFGIIEVNKISHHCNFLGKITGKIYRGTGKTQGIWKWNLCGHPVM